MYFICRYDRYDYDYANYVPGVTSKEVIDKITDDFGPSYEVIFKYVL